MQSGSYSSKTDGVICFDFSPGLFHPRSPPAATSMSGIQWPPSNKGSAHSSSTQRGLRGLLPVPVTADEIRYMSLWNFAAKASPSLGEHVTACETVTKDWATSARVWGSKFTTAVESASEHKAPATCFGDGAHTSQRACVNTTVGFAAQNSFSKIPYRESPMRKDPFTAVLISSWDICIGLISLDVNLTQVPFDNSVSRSDFSGATSHS
mmetsp:Transcript_85112/g.150531  ORF Transcript_85112/g.150531 Transcript_85112/m.150531 type:complete len:209 (+) Transcript_85112:1239-1865(+)